MQFVDEQDHPALGVLDFAEYRLEPLLELATVLGTGDQRAHIQRDHPFFFQTLRHVALHDPQGQSLDDSRLAYARFADQYRIVLGATGEHLNDATYLVIAADHRIDLILCRLLDQVDAVLFECVEFALGILVGDSGAAPQGLKRLEHVVLVQSIELEQVLGLASRAEQSHEQMLGTDILVLHRFSRLGCRFQCTAQRGTQLGLATALRPRQTLDFTIGLR